MRRDVRTGFLVGTAFCVLFGATAQAADLQPYTKAPVPPPPYTPPSCAGATDFFTDAVDTAIAYYHYQQNSFGPTFCNTAATPKCSGQLNAVGYDVEWKALKKLTLYAGVLYSEVRNGMASGYLNTAMWAPTAGLRFRW